jgi:hypothetical protein
MNKTIKINPNLLLVKQRREKKEKKEKKEKSSSTSKNVENLKRQLLSNLKTTPTEGAAATTATPLKDSLNYLSKLKEKKQSNRNWVEVNLDNPEALFPSNKNTTNSTTTNTTSNPLSLSTSLKDSNEVPYGCLKKGKKPTYRNYKRMLMSETRKNNHDIVESLENVRERKLEELKQKQHDQQQKEQQQQQKEQKDQETSLSPSLNLDEIDTNIAIQQDLELTRKLKNELAVIDELKTSSEEDLNKKKTLIKKTVCKKYILGKNEDKKIVSVLIKNADRKNEVIQAKQDLNRTKLNKVKNYLLHRNLMKKGSEAPTTLLLEMFKNARLTGDIYNVNFNTILETFVSET